MDTNCSARSYSICYREEISSWYVSVSAIQAKGVYSGDYRAIGWVIMRSGLLFLSVSARLLCCELSQYTKLSLSRKYSLRFPPLDMAHTI